MLLAQCNECLSTRVTAPSHRAQAEDHLRFVRVERRFQLIDQPRRCAEQELVSVRSAEHSRRRDVTEAGEDACPADRKRALAAFSAGACGGVEQALAIDNLFRSPGLRHEARGPFDEPRAPEAPAVCERDVPGTLCLVAKIACPRAREACPLKDL